MQEQRLCFPMSSDIRPLQICSKEFDPEPNEGNTKRQKKGTQKGNTSVCHIFCSEHISRDSAIPVSFRKLLYTASLLICRKKAMATRYISILVSDFDGCQHD